MARALLVFFVICSLAFAIVKGIETGDGDERPASSPADQTSAGPSSAGPNSAGPELEARPGALTQHTPNPRSAASDGERRWRVAVLSAEDDLPLEGVIVEAWNSLDLTGTPVRLGTTDAKGELAVVLSWRMVSGVFRKPGFVSAVRGFTSDGETVRLRPGLPVRGTVVGPGDEPIAGATVLVWDPDNQQALSGLLMTDGAGRFELEAVRPNHPFVVAVRAEGLAPRSVERTITRPEQGLVVRLGGGGVLTGVVTRHDGTPGANLDVRLLPPRVPIPGSTRRSWLTRRHRFLIPLTRTDREGRYEFPDVLLGKAFEVSVRVSRTFEGRSGLLRFERGGERQQRDIFLPAPASLCVTLVGEDGLRVHPEQVVLKSALGDFQPVPATQEGAPLCFPELSPGAYDFLAFVRGGTTHRESITLGPGEHRDAEFVIPAGLIVQGVVVDSAGAPLAGVAVWWTSTTPATTAVGQTDEAGRFALGGLEQRPGKLVVRALGGRATAGRALADVELGDIVPGGQPLRITLRLPGTIRGRFPDLPDGTRLPLTAVSRSVWARGRTTLGAKGRFTYAVPVAREPFFLLFRRADLAPLIVDFEAMQPGQDIDVGVLRFDPGFTLDAAVEDEQGEPVVGAAVSIAEKWSGAPTWTDADGRFAFPHLPKRSIRLRIDAKGYPMHVLCIDGQAFNPGTRLLLQKGGELLGSVVTSSGSPAAEAIVTVFPDRATPYDRDHDDTRTSFTCDALGRFHIRLQSGAYDVTALDAHRRVMGSARTEVEEGERREIELRLK